MKTHAGLKPTKDLQEAHNSTDWAFHYKTKAGQTTVALRLPGIEFVVQNMTGQKASDNREKFLHLIGEWKYQQSRTLLGKRPLNPVSSSTVPPKKRAFDGSAAGGGGSHANEESQQLVTTLMDGLRTSNAFALGKIDTGFVAVSAEIKGVSEELTKTGNRVMEIQSKVDASSLATNQQLAKADDRMLEIQSKVEASNLAIATTNKELMAAIRGRDAKIASQTYIINKLNADNARLQSEFERTIAQIGNIFVQNAKLMVDLRNIKVDVANVKIEVANFHSDIKEFMLMMFSD